MINVSNASRLLTSGIGAGALIVASLGVSVAAIPSATGVVTACVNTTTRVVRC